MKTRKSFYRAFRKIAKKYGFHIDGFHNIRGLIEEGEVCPLTAVYHHRTGKYMKKQDFDRAGLHLGLDDEKIYEIMEGADNFIFDQPKMQMIRMALIRAMHGA